MLGKLALFALLSILVFIGEVHMYFKFPWYQELIMGVLYNQTEARILTLFAIVHVLFGYMAFVSFYSIFSVEIFGFYGFYPGKTDPASFLSSVYYLSKMTYPLCYTVMYILLGRTQQFMKTAFFQVNSGDLEHR